MEGHIISAWILKVLCASKLHLNHFLLAFQAPKKAKKKEAGSSNVFSMFEQSQIQEFKEVGHF